jgi:hypothetical protein
MTPNILIVRDGGRYRVLHGLLRLTSCLCKSDEILLDVLGEGVIRIVKTPLGLRVHAHCGQLPLHLD